MPSPALEPLHRVVTAAAREGPRAPGTPDGLNRLILGDALSVMATLPDGIFDLIYLDPPFFSGRHYDFVFGDQAEVRSFSDVWQGGMAEYLTWLTIRLREMKRLLKPTGNLCVHLDRHASHYVKVGLDELFGDNTQPEGPGFKNEIVWCYSIGGKSKRTFARKHDVILWYANGPGHTFLHRSPHARVKKKPDSHMKVERDALGQVWQTKLNPDTGKVYRYPLDKIAEDWWTDIEQLNWGDPERLGYPTQKPEALLRRLVGALSPAHGLVADFFCGGGTTCAVAQQLGRTWVGADISRVAIALTADRISRLLAPDQAPPPRRVRRAATRRGVDPIAALLNDESRTGPAPDLARAVAASLYPAVGFTVERVGSEPTPSA